ncbi:N-terminal glutamine amidase-domain-containing protein [Powellomyces hirtus]|nr:N-terminal glutamine amidase-domain-containing protein [Powellomyces hirtus]
MVYDFDTTLSFPCPFVTYVGASFKPSRLPRSFRVIPAHDYLSFFASDRRHMRVDAGAVSDESWIAPPPSAPAISSLVVFDSSTYKVPQYDPEAAEYWGNAHRTPATNEHRLSLYIRMTKATTDWERIAENALVDQYLGKIVDLVGLPRYFQIGSVCCASEG